VADYYRRSETTGQMEPVPPDQVRDGVQYWTWDEETKEWLPAIRISGPREVGPHPAVVAGAVILAVGGIGWLISRR